MFFPPEGYFSRENWDSQDHKNYPQFDILKRHIDRAVQDLFLNSLRTQHKDFFYIFDNMDQIESFTKRMLKYWEKEENYEICSEILKLKKKMITKWKRAMAKDLNEGEELKEWLKSSL
jgi:hypothetical protein